MAEFEIIVKYKSEGTKRALVGVVVLLPIWGILLPLAIGFMAFRIFVVPSMFWQFLGPMLGMLLISALGVKTVLNLADNRIVITKFGIEFPFFLATTFGLRRSFPWAAIRDANVVERKNKREVVLYTTDGLPVYMDVKCFAPEELEQLLLGLDLWAIHCDKSPALQLLKDEMQTSSDQRQLPSYTAMWEDELSRRFSATAYVPLEPGHVLQDGRLKIVSQLSFGGLSAVYLCQRNERDLVILKEAVVPADNDDEVKTKAQELFEREAQILMKLSHPAIVRVMDHFVEMGRHYLMIEYHTGQDLSQLVKQNGAQGEHKVLKWALEIATILQYLHSQDPPIIHRDVTPDNLVLETNGSIIMIDFGAANEFLGKATGTLIGKQSFISPEQFRGKATVQSDLYAFGCTLNFLLTAQEPVPLSISHPRLLNASVSTEMDEFVSALTKMDLKDRTQSAEDCKLKILSLLARDEVLQT